MYGLAEIAAEELKKANSNLDGFSPLIEPLSSFVNENIQIQNGGGFWRK